MVAQFVYLLRTLKSEDTSSAFLCGSMQECVRVSRVFLRPQRGSDRGEWCYRRGHVVKDEWQ